MLKIAASKGASWLRPGEDARLIYDVTHQQYSNHSAKAAVWIKIGQQLKATRKLTTHRLNQYKSHCWA